MEGTAEAWEKCHFSVLPPDRKQTIVKIHFISEYRLEVICGIKSTNLIAMSENADNFIEILLNTTILTRKERPNDS
ncbi:MAG: hypothetical protein OXI24_07445 [Candidatus Poribacteria bacterium]|nr:hypothetical protein [Candidatus Poribacteria bacterium]